MTTRKGTFGAGFTGEEQIIETVYDFSADTGATGDYTLTAAASDTVMVKLIAVKTTTAPTSAGSALLTLETSATADAFLNSEPIATFSIGSVVIPENATTGGTHGYVKVAADATLQFSIEDAALTAGKMTFVWKVLKF